MKVPINHDTAEQILNWAEIHWDCTILQDRSGQWWLNQDPGNSIDQYRIFIGSNAFAAAGWILQQATENSQREIQLAGRFSIMDEPKNT